LTAPELQQLIDCPVDWYGKTVDGDFTLCMRAIWYLTVREHEVDQESNWLSSFDYELRKIEPPLVEDDDWRPDLANVREWIDRARADYLEFVAPFVNLYAADRTEYPKHYAAHGASDKRLRRDSRTGTSLLSPSFGPDVQLSMAWAVLASALEDDDRLMYLGRDEELDELRRLRDILSTGTIRIFVEVLGRQTGYAYGEPTNFACFEFDLSTPVLHVYPVSRSEHEASQGLRAFVVGKDYIY
jgi:hypothetical protein